ncbi:MAG TPA: hypothetical protein PLE45_04740 [Spirochaetota bacterium]|nr:hypothetical protein [Spirochaetota bacterium]HOL56607.1 hypothetical protein [Spirochaetota bacterium]HPP04030.1 hypothetical protein [Spirochaetota bacterium]
MTLLNFFLLILNILILIFGYLIIKRKFEKRYINREIIEEVKKEINQIIIKLNETTFSNISLIDEKIKRLHKMLNFVDKKISGLDKKIKESFEEEKKEEEILNDLTYSPQKIVKQSQKISETVKEEEDKKILEENLIEEEMKNMAIDEKVKFLIGKNWDIDRIKKKLNLSSGEIELIFNINSLNRIK